MSSDVATIKHVLAEKLRVSQAFLEDDFTLDELGLDSLTSAEIVLGVEKSTGVRLDLAALGERLSRDTKLVDLVTALANMLEQSRCPA